MLDQINASLDEIIAHTKGNTDYLINIFCVIWEYSL